MKPRRKAPRLVRVIGDAGEIMAGGKKGVHICSNALLIRPGVDWSVCTVFDAGEDRYITTEIKTHAIKRAIRRNVAQLGRATYKRALAAASDIANVGIGTVEMAVAWEVHMATSELVEKAKSCVVRDCVAEDVEFIYRDARDLCDKFQFDSPRRIARAVVECYEDNEMDMHKTHAEATGELFASTYLL